MVLNIGKYQIPYIQYSLFENYIAGNLCVNRYDEDNCCHGKCFLEKQINRVSETDEHSSANPAEKKLIQAGTDDYIPNKDLLPASIHFTALPLSCLTDNHLRKLSLDVTVPPPKRFI
ncbi:MAG: hypothetical protein LBS79_01930 [Tannerella sp.]|nr:hypothetical protein [Tannerella sp.]